MSTTAQMAPRSSLDKKLKDKPVARWAAGLFALCLVGGIGYVVTRLSIDLSTVHQVSLFPYFLLAVALLIALGFEFVNGFHDTANAVATVIYTHSLEPNVAVIWSGLWNFIGVMVSSGAVAFSIIAILPVQLVLRVSRGLGFSMVFALLVAAVIWNLVTWWRGLPVSSSHTMIGSIMGVSLANAFMSGHTGRSSMEWEQVIKVVEALVVSPMIGFVLAAVLFFAFKLLLRDPRLYEAPKGSEPPPLYIRALLILTCTGVSFAHGENDGQKGMGLIMLVLVGTVPTAYALNHAVDRGSVQAFANVSTQVATNLQKYSQLEPAAGDPAPELERFVATHRISVATLPALQKMVTAVRDESVGYGSLGNVPQNMQSNVRNQMYLTSESLNLLPKYGPKMSEADLAPLKSYKGFLDKSTKYIPTWVKVAVALALSLGTMVGWKRIVVTVGEKIGKTHLTYAQGAAAELVAMATILGAGRLGLPVSTTQVVSSGIAGTMMANGSGLQMSTLRNIALAWFFTLPAAALLSGSLFWLFSLIAK